MFCIFEQVIITAPDNSSLILPENNNKNFMGPIIYTYIYISMYLYVEGTRIC